jgi:hypothetical protein
MSRLRAEASGFIPREQLLAAPEFVPQANKNQKEMNALLKEINEERRLQLNEGREADMNALLREIYNSTRRRTQGGKRRRSSKRKQRKTRRRSQK